MVMSMEENGMLFGKEIYLRPMTEEDTDLIVLWRNREFVRRNFIYQKPFTREGHLKWIHTMVDAGKVVQFMICENASKRPVGSVYLRDIIQEHKRAEYGIFIGEEDAIGRGYGTQAVKLIVAYGFEYLHLHKIMLRVLAKNERARKSYEKAGFVQEAYLKDEVFLQGAFQDVIYMAMINEKKNGE